MSNSKGESRTLTRAKRERLARELAGAFADEDKLAIMKRAMKDDGAHVAGDTAGSADHILQLLGRRATCTSSAEGAVWNWIRATLREFGYGE